MGNQTSLGHLDDLVGHRYHIEEGAYWVKYRTWFYKKMKKKKKKKKTFVEVEDFKVQYSAG
jgi:hypothetical protein